MVTFVRPNYLLISFEGRSWKLYSLKLVLWFCVVIDFDLCLGGWRIGTRGVGCLYYVYSFEWVSRAV